MHVVVFAGGTFRPGSACNEALASADLIIAADKGAVTAIQQGYPPDIIVGDFDSLPSSLQAHAPEIIRVAAEKDETDTELALMTARTHGATRITLLGGLGGARFEHTVGNILLIADPDFASIDLRLADGPSLCTVVRGPGELHIEGEPGDLFSLFPLTMSAEGVRTQNLYYPLKGETLTFGKPRGISNVLTATQATVTLEAGILLAIHTRQAELQENPEA